MRRKCFLVILAWALEGPTLVFNKATHHRTDYYTAAYRWAGCLLLILYQTRSLVSPTHSIQSNFKKWRWIDSKICLALQDIKWQIYNSVMHPWSQRNTPTSRWLTYGLRTWKLHQSIVCPESTVFKANLRMRWWISSSSKSISFSYCGGSRLPCVISPFAKRSFNLFLIYNRNIFRSSTTQPKPNGPRAILACLSVDARSSSLTCHLRFTERCSVLPPKLKDTTFTLGMELWLHLVSATAPLQNVIS